MSLILINFGPTTKFRSPLSMALIVLTEWFLPVSGTGNITYPGSSLPLHCSRPTSFPLRDVDSPDASLLAVWIGHPLPIVPAVWSLQAQPIPRIPMAVVLMRCVPRASDFCRRPFADKALPLSALAPCPLAPCPLPLAPCPLPLPSASFAEF